MNRRPNTVGLSACRPVGRKPGCARAIHLIGGLLLSGLGLFGASPVWGMYVQSCTGLELSYNSSLPSTTFAISRQTSIGTLSAGWQYGQSQMFIMCTTGSAAASPNSDGIDKNLYVGGDKPAAVFPAPGNLTVTEDGVTYRVFTNTDFQQYGLGYIVRWRVTNGFNTGEYGEWVTPPSHNWSTHMPSPSDGMSFWRFSIYR